MKLRSCSTKRRTNENALFLHTRRYSKTQLLQQKKKKNTKEEKKKEKRGKKKKEKEECSVKKILWKKLIPPLDMSLDFWKGSFSFLSLSLFLSQLVDILMLSTAV